MIVATKEEIESEALTYIDKIKIVCLVLLLMPLSLATYAFYTVVGVIQLPSEMIHRHTVIYIVKRIAKRKGITP